MAHFFKCAGCGETIACPQNCPLGEQDHDLCDECYDELAAPLPDDLNQLFI